MGGAKGSMEPRGLQPGASPEPRAGHPAQVSVLVGLVDPGPPGRVWFSWERQRVAWGDIRGKNRGPGNSCWDPQVKPGGARLASAHLCHSPCCELMQHKECAIKARVGAGMAQRRGSAQLGGWGLPGASVEGLSELCSEE